MKGQKPANHN